MYLVLLIAFIFGVPISIVARESAPRPNIVVILADDLGYSDIGCYGGEIETPHLDSLARAGVRFRQFYNNAVCGPSRAALLTGLYPQKIGHTGKNWNEPTDYRRSVNLGEVLQRAGYHTMAVGKWQDPDLPVHRGFDRFYGPMCSGKISYFHEVVTNPFYLDGNRIGLPSDFYLTDALTENALAFLKEAHANPERREKPFFLYLAHIAPHWPLHAREAEVAAHRARYRQLGWNACQVQRIQRLEHEGLFPAGIKPASWPAEIHGWPQETLKDWQAERMAVHAAMVSALDRSAGKIIAQLRETGLLDNTLILFLSDNGAAPDGGLKPVSQMLGFAPSIAAGAKFRVDGVPIRPGSGPENLPGPPDTFQAFGPAWARVANTPYRDTKLSGYEGGIRTPLIAHWPRGIVSPGRIVPDLGHVMDLMPTFLELAGAPYPVEWDARRPLPLDGISLTPVFRAQPCASRSALFWQVPLHRVVRDPQWKAVASNSSGKWELYDLQSDPGETTNLAEKHPEILRGLSEKWASWAASHALK